VEAQPAGITIPELAAKMGIKQNYLYRVLPGLQKEGKVRKRGRTWFPRAA
jgi:DNA-binding IclR family transcriptional regulator